MKTQKVVRKSETLEDIVFEGRNKSYGAYDLERKRRRSLIIAFLISFVGFTTAIAIPFFDSLKAEGTRTVTFETPPVIIIGTKPNKPEIPVPPAPPPIDENVQKTLVYAPPIVVEELTNPDEILDWDKLQSGAINKPVDIDIEFVPADHGIIEEPPDDGPILFPSEPATFMGCADLTCFHKWVLEHIKYPDDAAAQNVFGKVILEFCISAKGEVVDVKVLRKIHPSIDEEAIRVITSSPIWSPARQGGKQVKQKFVIPCSFEMN